MYPSAVDVLLKSTEAPYKPSESQSYADHQWILLTVISSLSIFGSLTIILTYFIFQDLQSTTRKFLVYISFGDFFTVYPYLIVAWLPHNSEWSDSINCKVQSFVTTTAVMWSFFWTSSLAIYLYLVIVRKNQEQADKLMPYFHVINWGLPLALVTAACIKHMLGGEGSIDSGGWCWISLKHGRAIARGWMLACGKLWEMLSYFIDVILCYIVTRRISAEVSWQ
jgi:G protein-coupled receptor 157